MPAPLSKCPPPDLPDALDDNDSSAGNYLDILDSIKSEGDYWEDHTDLLPESTDNEIDPAPGTIPNNEDVIEAEGSN